MVCECKGCGLEFESNRKKSYCSDMCYPSCVKYNDVYFKNCVECNTLFTTSKSNTNVCSRKCKWKRGEKLREQKLGKKEYKARRSQLANNYIKRNPKFRCVQPLKSKITYSVCDITGLTFISRQNNKYHPLISREISNLRRYINYHSTPYLERYLSYCEPYKEYKCKECDKLYLSNYQLSKFCSSDCSGRYLRRIRRSKERARMREAKVETVDPFIVFNTYHWNCAYCGVHTPKRLRGKHLNNSPELDHIIPLSKGGEHSYDNVQLLCRQCNCNKSDKIYNYTRVYPISMVNKHYNHHELKKNAQEICTRGSFPIRE